MIIDCFKMSFYFLGAFYYGLSPCIALMASASRALFRLTIRCLNFIKSSASISWLNIFLCLESNPLSSNYASLSSSRPTSCIMPSNSDATTSLNFWMKTGVRYVWWCIRICSNPNCRIRHSDNQRSLEYLSSKEVLIRIAP